MQTRNAKIARTHRTLGDDLRQQGKWKSAIASYRQAVDSGLDDALSDIEALSRALIEAATTSDGRSLVALDKTLSVALMDLAQSESPASYVAAAEAFYLCERYEETAISLACALSLDPEFAPAREALDALVLAARLRRIDFQLATSRRALFSAERGYAQANSAAMEHVGLRLGHAFRDGGVVFSAIAAYSFAVNAIPSQDNFFHLGHAYRQARRFRSAADSYRKGIAVHPRTGEGNFYLAEALEGLNDLRGAMLSFEQAHTFGLSAAAGEWQRLFAKLGAMISQPPGNSIDLDADTAIGALVKQESAETYLRLATEAEANGLFAEAVYACGAALTHHAGDPGADRLVNHIIEQRILAEKKGFLATSRSPKYFP